jgi:hypothetical protein
MPGVSVRSILAAIASVASAQVRCRLRIAWQ